jgi:hypothetical protein
MSRKKFAIIVMPSAVILITLLFIPTNLFFGISSFNEESPSPMMVLENNDDVLMGFKIAPIGCRETPSGFTESHFQVTNTNENNYEVKIDVLFRNNEQILYEKQESVVVLSGQTIDQNHMSDEKYDNPVCVVKIVGWSKL